MPYIGNQHIVGDHINNFKVLDDISSYTETFNGASTNVISTSDDTIRIPEHRFIHGQRVTYTNGGGGNIGGLTSGQIYFISFHTKNTIKLATNLQNANNNVVVNLSSVGSGTSHTINAAFDGVNTKFKITYEGGKEGRFNNATQLNIAINNVIQRPNLNPITFTEGFAIEDHHKIIFKVAPTVNDIFWGSIIANTIENFDLRDNEVDNFTGDGSATEFTLSTIPANNESVIVTIDGVVQYPSDGSNTRAYSLSANVLTFVSAPANGTVIQARHIGFADPTVSGVTGFYGRTGNVSILDSDSIVAIQSAGTAIGTVRTLNFVGTGNSIILSGNTVDVSISGGGADTGFSTSTSGIHTTSNVGVNTNDIPASITGVGNSFQGMYVSNGMIIYDNELNGNHYIGTNFNGLMAGPVVVNGSLTVDGHYVVV